VPIRPRSHQIEDASRAALRAALPAEWILRDLTHDYGLDAEVEIVTTEGTVTGRRFNVQLKATDASDGATIRLAAETVRYYRALDLPVLLVLYRAARNHLRAQWFHAIDREFPDEQAEVTFRLDDSTTWSAETPAALDAELAAFRFFRSPALPLPLRVALEARDGEVLGEPSAEILRSIRSTAAETPGLASFGEGNHGAQVIVSESEVCVALGSAASFSWPTVVETGDAESLRYDVLVGLALALSQVGQVDLAARLVHRYAGRSALVADGRVVVEIGDILVRAHRPTEALDIIDELADDHPERAGMALYLMVSALRLASLQSPQEIERYDAFLIRQLERVQATGDDHQIGIAHYNLANHVRSRRQRKVAIRHYRLAVRAWPQYANLEYWNREIAGVLYHSGRYALSAHYYSRALEIGTDWPIMGVLGDALMFSGRYREALERLVEATDTHHEFNVEWSLKRWFLENLTQWGVEDQVRQTRAAERRVEEIRESMTGVEARDALHAALQLDWLSGLLWFNLGVAEERELRNPDAALFAFIACGLCQPGDVEAWVNAIIVAAKQGAESAHANLIEAVGQFAYFANGDSLLEQLSKVAREQGDGFPVADFVNGFEQAILAVQSNDPAPSGEPERPLPALHVRLHPDSH
jgi:tetratricopeptide (TPR) repeat protein